MRCLAILTAVVLPLTTISVNVCAQEAESILIATGKEARPAPHVTFTENLGQWPDSILFRGEAAGNVVWITSTGWYIELYQPPEPSPSTQERFARLAQLSQTSGGTFDAMIADSGSHATAGKGQLIGVRLEGANPHPQVIHGESLPSTTNYFLGSDSSRWRRNVPSYTSIELLNVYDGMDIEFYGKEGRLEYDFRVSAGADPAAIKMVFSGQECLDTTSEGELLIGGLLDTVVQHRPIAYQEDGGKSVNIGARFIVSADGQVRFGLDEGYNRSCSVVIDPVITFSRYLGGGRDEAAQSIVLDDQQNMYVTGHTSSNDFPTTAYFDNSYDINWDAFITKLSPNGDIVYSALLGGSRDDYPWAITLGPDNSAYIVGTTFSWDYPIANALMNGGDTYLTGDAFVTRLSPDGTQLVYSTHLGGGLRDDGGDIVVDSRGAALVVGNTASSEFHVTRGVDTTFNGGLDLFLLKLSPYGDSLEFGTFWGGSGHEGEWLDIPQSHLAVDRQGYIYVGSWTWSRDFPLLRHVDSTVIGYTEAFVVKFTPLADSVIYSTLLGGDYIDQCSDIAVDSSGRAYVIGLTADLGNFPVPPPGGVYRMFDAGNRYYMCRLSPSGAPLLTTIFFGFDVRSLVVDRQNRPNIVGGEMSASLQIFSPSGDERLFAGSVGGGQKPPGGWNMPWDSGNGVALGADGSVYLVGGTGAADFPVTYPGSFIRGWSDAFVLKIEELPTSVVEANAATIPTSITLGHNYPNPFNSATRFRIAVPSRQLVVVDVFNMLGQCVATLINSELKAGDYTVEWKGTNDAGEGVASGVYLYRLTTARASETKKMILLK